MIYLNQVSGGRGSQGNVQIALEYRIVISGGGVFHIAVCICGNIDIAVDQVIEQLVFGKLQQHFLTGKAQVGGEQGGMLPEIKAVNDGLVVITDLPASAAQAPWIPNPKP